MAKRRIVICKECGQEAPNKGKGLCRRCYDAQYTCPLQICGRCQELKPAHGHGLCKICYNREYRVQGRGVEITCSKCDQESRHQAGGLCRPCYMEEWHEEHQEHDRRYRRQYYQEHAKEARAYAKEYRKNNPEQRKRWREANRERVLTQRRHDEARRRARKALLPDTLTPIQADAMLARLPCFYCGANTQLTLDHFVPIAGGGGTTLANSVVACENCNRRKNAKMPTEVLGQLALVEELDE